MILSEAEKLTMKRKLKINFEEMIEIMKFDLNSPHLKGTPERMARMYVDELFTGCYTKAPRFTIFSNDTNSTGMVFLGNIDIFSTCAHHYKSFSGIAHIAYIPAKDLVGISKLARIANWYARRPQIQEILTDQIADCIQNLLDPIGVAVTIEAVHNCIRVRGASQSSSKMMTTSLRGSFLENKSQVAEFDHKIDRLGIKQ